LLAGLAELLPADRVHTDHLCTGYRRTGAGATLSFSNGASVAADVAIAADGIHSVLQKHVTTPPAPVHSGSVAYRGLIPAAALPGWPPNTNLVWMGEGKHFMVYPVRSGTVLNYVGFVPSDDHPTESWSSPGDSEALRKAFKGWDTRIGSLLDQVDDTYWWSLNDRVPLDRWTDGTLALLGDAAHPMLPHLGQGANQAIEDGFSLATLFERASNREEALGTYEALRRPRTAWVQENARTNGRRYDSSGAYRDETKRDAEIAKSHELRSVLHDYDAQQEAEEAELVVAEPLAF
jgi:salicylate hydroxylase